MKYDLITSVTLGGREYSIRSDFRAILDIIEALNDVELNDEERALVVLNIFYPDFEEIPQDHLQDALNACMDYINGNGPKSTTKAPRLVDWEMDWPLIIAPINRVLGYELRSIPYDAETNTGGVSWETFLAAYQEIGDCTFSQVVRIRDHLARGKKLDKQDQEWYRRNRHLVDIKRKYTAADDKILKAWGGA